LWIRDYRDFKNYMMGSIFDDNLVQIGTQCFSGELWGREAAPKNMRRQYESVHT